MKIFIVLLAALFSTHAFAFGDSSSISGANAGAASNATSNATSYSGAIAGSHSSSSAQQQQGQAQHQGQGQIQGQANVNKSSGNVAINHAYRKNLRNAPSFGLPAAFPTAVCQGTLAAGFSFWLGGGAAAGTITIEECMKLETIRVGTIMLQNAVTPENAIAQEKANTAVFCMTKYGSQTEICGGATKAASAEAAPVVAVVAPKKVAGIPDEVVTGNNGPTVFDDIGSLFN